jgi:hypothetical protein
MELAFYIFIKSCPYWQMHYPHTRPLHSGYCQVSRNQRDYRGVDPAHCSNWGEWGLKEYKMKRVLPWLVSWTCRASTIVFCPALAALVSPVQISISLTAHFFTLSVPFAQQPGQAGLLGRLSLCLRSQPKVFNYIAQIFTFLHTNKYLRNFRFTPI